MRANGVFTVLMHMLSLGKIYNMCTHLYVCIDTAIEANILIELHIYTPMREMICICKHICMYVCIFGLV